MPESVLKALAAVIGVASFGVIAWTPAQAIPVTGSPVPVTVNGANYSIFYENLQYSTSTKFNTTDMPWWGNQDLAGKFANALGAQLGAPLFGVYGPLFGWQENGSRLISVWFYTSNGDYYDPNPSSPDYSPYPTPQIANCPNRCPSASFPYLYAILAIPPGIIPGNDAIASNPYSTTFAGGTVVVDAPGSYATPYAIGAAGGTININGNTSIFSGVFSGSGPLAFVNTGAGGSTSLTALNTYTGPTTINNGADVRINGSIGSSSSLTVQVGGTVGGNGLLPATTVNPGGIISPGNSIGTLTAASLNLNGGTINAEIQGPQADRINVTGGVGPFTGTANLIAFGGGGPWPGFTYTIVSAPNSPDFSTTTPLTLQPAGVPSALLGLGTTLIQEADGNSKTFDVRWQPNNGTGATASAMQALGQSGVNQLATAGAFDRVFQSLAIGAAGNANNAGDPIGFTGFSTGQAAASGLSADFLGATASLLSLTSGSQLSAAINSLSPEPYAAFQSVGLETLKRQRELLMAQAGSCTTTGWVVNGSATKTGKTSSPPWCVFALAANGSSTINGNAGLSSYGSSVFSSYYGVEVQAGRQWTVGAAYGHGTSSLNNVALANAAVTAGVNSVSVYGVYKPTDRWNVRGLVGYTNFNGSGSRNVAFIGNGSAIEASTNANGYNVAVNADYRIDLSPPEAKTPAYLKPLLGLAWGGYQQLSFGESNGGPLNLQVQGHTASSLVGTVGLELATAPIPLNKSNTTAITPRLAVAYQVDVLGNDVGARSLTSSFPGAPAAGSFTTQGENRGVNTFVVDGGVDLKVATNATLYATVGYEVFSNGSQFTYGGGVKVKF